MLAGATCIDFVVLVVARRRGHASDRACGDHRSPRPDEGRRRPEQGDLASKDRIAAVGADIEALLRGTGWKARRDPGFGGDRGRVDRLAARIDAAASLAPERSRMAVRLPGSAPSRLRARDNGGQARSSRQGLRWKSGHSSPSGLEARVPIHSRREQSCPKPEGRAKIGARALSGPRVSKDAIHRGDMALDPALHAPPFALRDIAGSSNPSRKRSATGFPSGCIMPRARPGGAWFSSAASG